MEHKIVLGSRMLQMNNPRDTDEIVLVDKPSWEVRDTGCRSIPFTRMIIDHFIKGKTKANDPYTSFYIFQLSAPFFDDKNYPLNDFNILEHKEVWINQLKGYINHGDTEAKALAEEMLPKRYYHLLYQYHMIKENTHRISDEARVNVQKIHDLEMPSSYFYELRDLINSLD